MRKKARPRRYKVVYDIRWGPVFTLDAGQEFTEADLLPGMEAALAKWKRVGAVVEVEVKEAEPDALADAQKQADDLSVRRAKNPSRQERQE